MVYLWSMTNLITCNVLIWLQTLWSVTLLVNLKSAYEIWHAFYSLLYQCGCFKSKPSSANESEYIAFVFTDDHWFMYNVDGGGRESGLHEAAVEVLHDLLLHLVDAENPSGVSQELREQFVSALRREFPLERTPVVLTPLLYPEKCNLSIDQLNPTTLSLPRSVVSNFLVEIMTTYTVTCKDSKWSFKL